MKQKILIGASSQSNKTRFHKRLQVFLNAQDEYFLTFLCLDQFHELVLVQSETSGERFSASQIVKKIEFEMEVEMLPEQVNFNIDVFKPRLDPNALNGLTSVADLMVIDSDVYNDSEQCQKINDLISTVNCPVMVLPNCDQVGRIIMVHDPALHSIRMVKDFLRLFNQDLTQLPLTVLFAFPDNEEQTVNEKYFVEYLKMAFPNLGMQLMVGDPLDEFLDNFNAEPSNALVLVGNQLAREILEYKKDRNEAINNVPLFINKQ